MPNQYVNKVVINGTTKVDLTADTVDASHLAQGYTAHDASGASIIGTMSGGGSVTQDANGFIVLPSTGGGSGDAWSWMGRNPTLVKTYAKEKVYFKNTDFPNWTWSTTSTKIVDTTSYAETVTTDFTSYDYIVLCKVYVHTEYGNWTPVNAVTDFACVGFVELYGYPSTLAAKQSGTVSNWGSSTVTIYRMYNKNSQGNDALNWSTGGLYTTNPNQYSVLGTTILTVKRPIMYAVGNASYFTSDAFANCDMDASYYEFVTEVWRVDKPTCNAHSSIAEVFDILDNGL